MEQTMQHKNYKNVEVESISLLTEMTSYISCYCFIIDLTCQPLINLNLLFQLMHAT